MRSPGVRILASLVESGCVATGRAIGRRLSAVAEVLEVGAEEAVRELPGEGAPIRGFPGRNHATRPKLAGGKATIGMAEKNRCSD